MKVAALVSGGKDSCYSILQCQAHGHKVVALANLLPPAPDVDELDSYMYQTVGHQLVEAYASCMNLTLYRRRISGHAKQQGLAYAPVDGDEVEDLFALLSFIKEKQPDVQAVASGAIASDYQRLRVENVCSRLGLVSLAYLWHQPQSQLLQRMIDAEIHAVLVKVAAMGLEPHKHLGKTLQQIFPLMHKLRGMYGCNVCGEGGEYETLTLDCPAFTHGSIVLDSWELVMHSPGSLAGVGVLHPTDFRVEAKGEQGQETSGAAVVVDVPLEWSPDKPQPGKDAATEAAAGDAPVAVEVVTSGGSGSYINIRCMATVDGSAAGPKQPFPATVTEAALHKALTALGQELQRLELSWQHTVFVHLYLANMEHFATANRAYCTHFPAVNPPSRACVELQLPSNCPLMVDVLVAGSLAEQGLNMRRVLHVQSISEWAPSCIGPYSQATSHGQLIHMAGQIGLDPASMNLVPGGLKPECERCLESCEAVSIALGSSVATSSLAVTVFISGDHTFDAAVAESAACVGSFQQKARGGACSKEREEAQDESEEEDSDVYHGLVRPGAISASTGSEVDEYLQPPLVPDALDPPVVYVQVPRLPRGAAVEVQVVALDVRGLQRGQREGDSEGSEPNTPPSHTTTGSAHPWQRVTPWEPQVSPRGCYEVSTRAMVVCGSHLQGLVSVAVRPPCQADPESLSRTIFRACASLLSNHNHSFEQTVVVRVWLSQDPKQYRHGAEHGDAVFEHTDLQANLSAIVERDCGVSLGRSWLVVPLVVPVTRLALKSVDGEICPYLAVCEIISIIPGASV